MRNNAKLKVTGTLTVEKYKLGEDSPYEVQSANNSLTTAGKDQLLDLIGGIATTSKLSATAVLRVYNSGPTLVKTLTATEAGYPSHSTGSGQATLSLRWRDGSTDTYNANILRVYFSGDTIQLNTSTPAFGTKPTNEAWIYTFTLTLAAGDATLPAAGIDNFLKICSGVSVNYLTAANTQLNVHTDSGLGTEVLALVDATSVGRVTETLTWSWTVAAAVGTGTWGYTRVRNQADVVYIRAGNSSAGSKGALVQRTYTYAISL